MWRNERNGQMARNTNTADVEVVDVVENDELESVETVDGEKKTKTAKPKAEPKRGELPEGYVTPIGLAKILSERGLHTNREGVQVEVKPQMVYSYIKNAPEADKFPMETVTDSVGSERQAVKAEEGVAWWVRKNERTASRRASAAEKAKAKAERKAAKEAAEAEGADEVDEAVEAATEAE